MRAAISWALGIFAVAVLPYLPAVHYPFQYDDFHSLVRNPHIRTLSQWPRFFVDPASFSEDPHQAMYRPLLVLSYALNYAAGGMDPAGFRWVDIILHGLNAVLVLVGVGSLTGDARMGRVSAVLFALTPLNTEAVVYVSSRSDLLMGTLVLSSCVAHAYGGPPHSSAQRRSDRRGPGHGGAGSPGASDGVSRWGRLLLRLSRWEVVPLAAAAAALMVKSTAVVLPAAWALCDLYRGGRRLVVRRWPVYGWGTLLGMAYFVVTHRLMSRALLRPVRPLDVQLWTQFKVWVYQIFLLLVPLKLSIEHAFSVAGGPTDGVTLLAAGLVASLLVAGVALWRRGVLSFAMGWTWLWILPASLVPLIVLVSEHRLYVSAVGPCMVAAWGLREMARRRAVLAWWGAGAWAMILMALAVQRAGVWRDATALWRDAAIKAPASVKAHLRLGDALAAAGDTSGAEVEYLQAVKLSPYHRGARNNLGRLYLEEGRLNAAQRQFRALLDADSLVMPARLNLASALLRQGKWRQARQEYARAARQGDSHGVAARQLAWIALRHEQDPARAVRLCRQAMEEGQGGADVWRLLGLALRGRGSLEEAAAAYEKSLRIDDTQADVWYNLGNLRRAQGRWKAAISAYRRAARAGAGTRVETWAQAQLDSLEGH